MLLPEIVIISNKVRKITLGIKNKNDPMKTHLSYNLAVLLGLCCHLSRAQSHELVFKAGPASYNSSRALLDSRFENSRSVDKGFGLDLGYGYYFANDNYLRLSGSYSATSFERKGSSNLGNVYNEWRNELKVQSFGANLEFGKRLSYKFIDFLAGLGAGYYAYPSYKSHDVTINRPAPGNPNAFSDSESRAESTIPGMQVMALSLNTSLYFRVWKPLYLGVEVGNGFSFSKQKGDRITETTQTLGNGSVYSQQDKQSIDESHFNSRFFNTKLAIRYVFGMQKS